MYKKLIAAAFLFAAVCLAACKRSYVSLDFTNAKGEVARLGNLVFRFSQAIYPDSLVNSWDSTGYVDFEPAIAGRFRWNGPDELIFSPSQPLRPATTYKATVKTKVLHYSKYNRLKDAEDMAFHTAPLQLNDAQVTWMLLDEGSKKAVPQITLQFNYPVDAEAVKDKLQIAVDGVKADYALQSIGAADIITLRLASLAVKDQSYEAQISIDKGLKPEKGANSTDEPIKTTVSIPSPYVLNINSVTSEHDGTQGVVHINTSQQLNGENVSSFIKFEPAVSYTVDYEESGITLRSDKFDADNSYTFTISRGLRGRIGGVLKEDYYGSVAFGELESDVKFTNSKAVYLSKKGGGNIEVRITNTPKVKLVISKIYENNLLTAQKYGYEPADRQEEESSRYEGEGEGEYGGYSDAVSGDIIYTKEIDTRSLPKSGNGRILNLSQFEDRLPESKGIYHIMIRSAKDYWVRDSRFLSFSDIGLIAKQGSDKMYVFANSIKTAGPVSGVTINVYGANNQLLGTAPTGSDGTAEVPIAAKSFGGFKPAMIVARTADDFTYLPFNNTKVNTSRFDVGGKHINATGLDAFVYAERDIYRPGEKVNFAVALRDKAWKSPGEIPVKLKFLMPNGKELKSFRRSLNDGGATEGSVDISASAITGSYSLEVYSSNDVLLTTQNFMIEEFVPDRMKVTAKLDKASLRPSESATLNINAVNFFGPPAANRSYETEIQIRQKEFSAKNYPAMIFLSQSQGVF